MNPKNTAYALADKYYCSEKTAKCVYEIAKKFFPKMEIAVEPSAGKNTITNAVIKGSDGKIKVHAYDLIPESPNIIKANYLTAKINCKPDIHIGNPPFGKKGNLAVAFLNKALKESGSAVFVMPITAEKYSVQRHINPKAKLICSEPLPENAFELPNGTPYSVKSIIQVWTLKESKINLRESPPKTKHRDFELYRHNATPASAKYIDKEWDFAVYAQGHKDYGKIFTSIDKNFIKDRILNSSDQFYFFKACTKAALKRLKKIDFRKLAHKGTITPGFCKNDIIKEYSRLLSNLPVAP